MNSADRSRKFRLEHPEYYKKVCKAWRQSHPGAQTALVRDWRSRNRIKSRAHLKVQSALSNGTLTRQPCSICGAEKAHAHHADYTKPLDVTWLCQLHHNQEHRK